jgi:NADH:ubiquinone oxidoreductase subunit 5 (subunit L)/multisubunit Na+/H+ antiporter MnhA subunit
MVRAVFFGEARLTAHDAPHTMSIPMSPLILLVVVLGFLATPILAVIANSAAALALL